MLEQITDLISQIKSKANGRVTGFVIGNTSDLFENIDYYATPLRHTSELIYVGVVVKNVETAKKIASLIDGQVDFIFVDAEKKIRKIYYGPDDVGNIERVVRETIKQSKIVTYKGNDLTVESIDMLLGQLIPNLGNCQVAIVGAGNLGSKVAIRLVERGAHIRLYRRQNEKLEKIAAGINAIKFDYTMASVTVAPTLIDACRDADIIIACANEKGVIPLAAVKSMDTSKSPILIDAGKGCFAEEVATNEQYEIFRTDVRIVQENLFTAIVKMAVAFSKPFGRRVLENGLTIISAGLLAKYGEVVVDDITQPTQILGIGDGKGALLSKPHPFEEVLTSAQNLIKKP